MVAKVCPKCNSSDIDSDGSRGEAVCTNCGHVLEECAIVSEVSFAENSGGQSSVVGQFVPENGISSFRCGPGYGGFGNNSRELTLANGKRLIQQIAQVMHLGNDHIDVAHRFFQQAVQRNFIQGRKTHNVVAVCLYITCRFRKTSHMLIDFAENLQTDVYELGSVFLKFCKLLVIKLDPIDPSLYIHRFAGSLEFGDKANAVATTAIRVVANMNREWMTTGRRPAGICGAGLLIAAKMHRFHRTEAEVAQVVRICDGTLKKRLNEFDETMASEMTVPQFNALFKTGTVSDFADANTAKKEQENWVYTNARQPPSLKHQEKKRKQMEEAAERRAEEGDGDDEIPPLEELSSQANKILQSSKALRELDQDHEVGAIITADKNLKVAALKEAAGKDAKEKEASSSAADGGEGSGAGASSRSTAAGGMAGGSSSSNGTAESSNGAAAKASSSATSSANSDKAVKGGSKGKEAADGGSENASEVKQAPRLPTRSSEDAEFDDDDSADENMAAEAQREEEEAAEHAAANAREQENERLSDVDDDEIESYIRTTEEACQRETTWNELNRDYIEKQAEKQRCEEMKDSTLPQDRQVKRKRRELDNSVSSTAHEAASKMLRNRNLSNKVNYDALEELFGG